MEENVAGLRPCVGVVGLGIMGSAYARHLVDAGFPVVGTDVAEAARAALAEAGGRAVARAEEVGAAAQVVLLALPTPQALDAVAPALAESLSPGAIVCEMGTLPLATKEAARERLAAAGVVLLDCPVSGTGAQAARGDIVVFASGERTACERVQPVFAAFARETRHVGDFGAGMKLKLVANLLVTIHNLATAEAMLMARRAGLDLDLVREAVHAGAGQSRVFDLRSPLMAEERYRPATMKMAVHMKDVNLILDFARSLGTPAPLTEASLPWYAAALDEGRAEDDTAALFAVLAGRVAPKA